MSGMTMESPLQGIGHCSIVPWCSSFSNSLKKCLEAGRSGVYLTTDFDSG